MESLLRLLFCATVGLHAFAAISLPNRSPANNATLVGAAPILQWMPDGVNLLENGGFENGSAGWETSAGGDAAIIQNASIAAEGEHYFSFPSTGYLHRLIDVPAGPGRKFMTFRTAGPPLTVTVQLISIDGSVRRFINHRWQGLPPSGAEFVTWVPNVIELTEFSGQTVRFTVNFEGNFQKRADDFRLVVVPEDITYRVYLNATLMGETTGYTMPLVRLVPGVRYEWRVASVSNGVITEGATWRFTTANSATNTRLLVQQPLPRVCPDEPVSFQIIGVNDYGFTNNLPTTGVVVNAISGDASVSAQFTPLSAGPGGAVTGSVVFANPPESVKLMARRSAPGLPLLTGESDWFELLPQGRCLDLLVAGDVSESAGELTAILRLAETAGTDLEITLTSSNPQIASVPARLTLPARTAEINIPITLHDDQRLTGSRLVTFTANAIGQSSSTATLRVMDNERATIRVTGPATVREGTEVARFDVTVDPTPEVFVRPIVRFNHPIFETQTLTQVGPDRPTTAFNANRNDFFLTGNLRVVATVEFENWIAGQAEFEFIDTEPQIVVLEGHPFAFEGQPQEIRVRLGGITPTDRVVALTSANPNIISLPQTVIIPAGSREVAVTLQPIENSEANGRQTVNLTVSSEGLTPQTVLFTVEDNDAFRLEAFAPPGPWERGESIPIRLQLFNRDNIEIPSDFATARFRVTDSQTSAELPFTVTPAAPNKYGFQTAGLAINAASPAVIAHIHVGDLQKEIRHIPVWETRPRDVIKAAYSRAQNAFVVTRTNQPITIFDASTGAPRAGSDLRAGFFELAANGHEIVALSPEGASHYRIDLRDRTSAVNPIIDRNGAPLSARLLTLVGGDANRLVLFRENESIGYADIALYENGTELWSERAGSSWGQISVGQSEDTRNFYVVGRTPTSLEWYARNDNYVIGLVRTAEAPPIRDWMTGRVNDIAFGENRFISLRGIAFDARSGAYAGATHQSAQFYLPTAYNKLTGCFATLLASTLSDYELWVLDARTLHKRKQTLVAQIGVPQEIVPAAERGWIIIDDGNFRIVPDPEDPPTASADLRLRLELVQHPSHPRVARARLIVENDGPNSAENAIISITIPPGTTLLNTPAGTVRAHDITSWPHALGTVAPGARDAYDFDLTRATTGELQVGFWLGSDAHETRPQDNNTWFDWHITVDESAPAPTITSATLDENGMLRIRYRGQAGWLYHLIRGDLAENRVLGWLDQQRSASDEGEFAILPGDGQFYFLRREP